MQTISPSSSSSSSSPLTLSFESRMPRPRTVGASASPSLCQWKSWDHQCYIIHFCQPLPSWSFHFHTLTYPFIHSHIPLRPASQTVGRPACRSTRHRPGSRGSSKVLVDQHAGRPDQPGRPDHWSCLALHFFQVRMSNWIIQESDWISGWMLDGFDLWFISGGALTGCRLDDDWMATG